MREHGAIAHADLPPTRHPRAPPCQVFLLGARLVAHLIYEDIDTYNALVLQRLHAKTDLLMLMIRDMQAQVRGQARGGGAGSTGSAGAPLAEGELPWPPNADQLAEAFKPLHPAMAGQAAGAARGARKGAAPPAKPGGRGLSSLVWFFGVYFFFQWLLGRSE